MSSATDNQKVVAPDFAWPGRVLWRNSLWLRLSALITVTMMVVLGAVLWVSGRVLEQTALRTSSDRALTAATQVAAALGQNSVRALFELQRLDSDPVLRRFLEQPTGDLAEQLRQRLRPLATPGQPPPVILSSNGTRLLAISGRAPDSEPSVELPEGIPAHIGIGPMHDVGELLYSDVVIEVKGRGDDAGDGATTMGFVVLRRLLLGNAGQNAEIINRLVGTGASAAMGNRTGSTPWTNFVHLIPVPPFDVTTPGSRTYTAADGTQHVAAISIVDNTPWAIWIDFPQTTVLAPMQTIVRRMALLATGGAIIAIAFTGWLVARAIKPLNDLTAASEAIASGQYSKRVAANRRDEIGRLGAAFNTMTDRVAEAHRELETRVEQRTASLEQAREELERQLDTLKKTRAEIDHFFALSPDLLCVADTDGRFVRLNGAWRDALGWELEELSGQPYIQFVHPDDVPATMMEAAALATGSPTRMFENRYRAKDGSYRWLSWRAVPVAGTKLAYATARDVTERRRVARQLEQRAAELADVNQELEAFSYSVSHDLRAPLRHIQGFVTFLDKSVQGRLDERESRWLTTIGESASRMSHLIDDLLAFSRMNRTSLNVREVALADIVRDARRELAPDPQSARVTWSIAPLPSVDADPALLQMVVVNLLSNALKYTRSQQHPVIAIGTVPGGQEETVVFVRDNGVGFDMKYAHKLFGVFQRLHLDSQFEGTGIGLANVRRIIQRHGGRTWAEGALNEGATFYFSLPRQRA